MNQKRNASYASEEEKHSQICPEQTQCPEWMHAAERRRSAVRMTGFSGMKRLAAQVWKRISWSILRPWFEGSVIVWGAFFLSLVDILIFLNAKRLGIFFFPVFIFYNASLHIAFLKTQEFKANRDLRAFVGDEVYFAAFPKAKKRWERRLLREELGLWAYLRVVLSDLKASAGMRLHEALEGLRWSMLRTVAETFTLVGAASALILVTVVLFLSSKTLGIIFWPVMLLYAGLLIVSLAMVLGYRARQDLLAVVGPETYFELYPKDRRRWERKLSRQARLAQKV